MDLWTHRSSVAMWTLTVLAGVVLAVAVAVCTWEEDR